MFPVYTEVWLCKHAHTHTLSLSNFCGPYVINHTQRYNSIHEKLNEQPISMAEHFFLREWSNILILNLEVERMITLYSHMSFN